LALFQIPGMRGRTLDRLDQVIRSRSREQAIYVFPQCPVLGYRVDFLLIGKNVQRPIFLVVECDGAPYHSAAADEKRDQRLTAAGFEVFRFTGSDIYRLPALVISETCCYFGVPRAQYLPHLRSIDLAIWQLRQRLPPPPPKTPFTDKFLGDIVAAFKSGRAA
jgi:very-short-patch-repair endonuclease